MICQRCNFQIKRMLEMKRHAILSFLTIAIVIAGFAREPRNVVLVVQNHAESGATIAFMALTDALTARLANCNMRVINPYNSVGINQNRDARGEKTPGVSAMELARRLKADGAVTASVVEFRETPSSGAERKFVIHMILNLADAQTGATVCGATVCKTSPKYTAKQIDMHRADYISKLMYMVADECADQLKENPLLKEWEPTPPRPPKKKPAPLPPSTSIDKKVDALVKEMFTNPQFVKNYENSKAMRDDHLPIVVIGGLENKTGNVGLDELIKAAGEYFRVKLFNSKLFEVKDDGVLVALAKRIVASGNSPLEDGEIMSALKQHGSPEFFVVGDFKSLTDLDGIDYYKFRISIHSLSNGKIVWEGIETFNRKRGAAK